MATIIITIVLNLLIGSPAEDTKEQNKDGKKSNKENTIRTNGGSGAWTNVEK
ncbi:hypothetical protein [uncultured Pontibacter sp.]|uniref:hypothetical protein n=1 Tax=uncultured Pontibacter sp. TaxID=453356 RepID=UPI00262046A2|nr:hypothetical protein [uncultured Pontibacter sp.]